MHNIQLLIVVTNKMTICNLVLKLLFGFLKIMVFRVGTFLL